METPAERITGFLASNASRVMDLLIAWDKDKNGLISRQEFYAFIKGALGFVVKREATPSTRRRGRSRCSSGATRTRRRGWRWWRRSARR